MTAITTDSREWFVLAVILAVGWLLYLLAPVLAPFLFSALLAYLGDPIVDRLERRGFSRTVGVLTVFTLMGIAAVLAIVLLVPMLEHQVFSLLNALPTALDWLQNRVAPKLAAMVGVNVVNIDVDAIRQALVEHWRQVGSVASQAVATLTRSGAAILEWLTYLLLVPVVTFYLLRDWDNLVAAVHELLPQRIAPTIAKLAREIDLVLAEFLRGQLTVMAALALIYISGLWMVGLDLAFVIGVLAGLVSFVPYLGVIVGLTAATLAAFLQFHDAAHLIGAAAVFATGQLLEGMVLSPMLVGERIGLHPVAVMFAVMAGGQLFGFFGVLVALPVAAAVVVVLRHSRDHYLQSALYGP